MIREIEMVSNFNKYASLYDLLYCSKNYSKEAQYVLGEYEALGIKNSKKILDLGSGTGSHGNEFIQNGYSVIGIERSIEMIEASRKTRQFNCINGDITDLKMNAKFDLVTSLFHVMSYVVDNQDLNRLFKLTNGHLEEDGIFYFDYWYAPAVLSLKPQTKKIILENDTTKVIRYTTPQPDWTRNVVDIKFDFVVIDKSAQRITEFTENHLMRYFSIPEIELFAANSGFRVLKHEEMCTAVAPCEETWAIGSWLKKIENA